VIRPLTTSSVPIPDDVMETSEDEDDRAADQSAAAAAAASGLTHISHQPRPFAVRRTAMPNLPFSSHCQAHFDQGSYRSGKTGKTQGIRVVLERSGKYFSEKLEKMKNLCHQMSDFQAKMHQI